MCKTKKTYTFEATSEDVVFLVGVLGATSSPLATDAYVTLYDQLTEEEQEEASEMCSRIVVEDEEGECV